MNLAEGQFLCKEGDSSNTLYIVKDGILRATSTQSSEVRNYGPGSIIGELNLLEGSSCAETILALEDSEIQAISHDTLEGTLQEEPGWLRSILTFLTGRYHIAEENHRKNSRVIALPTLLFLLNSLLQESGDGTASLKVLQHKMQTMINMDGNQFTELANSLHQLNVLKLQGDEIKVESPSVIRLLYETIQYRATQKKVSPNILSMTEQMILAAVVKAVQESHEPQQDGTCTVSTESIRSQAKKAMHGMTLTSRIVMPLVEQGLLIPSKPTESSASEDFLESIPFFRVDFEKVLDIMELNRIFPLLDKKLA